MSDTTDLVGVIAKAIETHNRNIEIFPEVTIDTYRGEAQSVFAALEPHIQQRERDAAQRERDRLAAKARSFPNGGLHVDAGAIVNGQQQWMTLSAWLSIQDDAATTDTAATDP